MGVVTIGALLGMAAHLEGKGVTVLDMTGLAQKGGAVMSHVQIAASPEKLHATRVATGEAALLIGCYSLVSASPEVMSKAQHNRTKAAINSANVPTAEFLGNPTWTFAKAQTEGLLRDGIGEHCEFIDATASAVALLGDSIYANPLLLGYAWQKGWLPVSHAALVRAIELNGVSVEKNRLAFELGRYLAEHGVKALDGLPGTTRTAPVVLHVLESLDKTVARLSDLLAAYQNDAHAKRYRTAVERVRQKEASLGGNASNLPLTKAVARNLAKLMAYKDEYEVARLYSEPAFLDKLRMQFEGESGKDYQLSFYLAPPMIAKRDDKGHLVKRRFGAWMLPAFRLVAKFKGLRGTRLDLFGRTEERRMERQLVADYFALVDEFCQSLTAEKVPLAVELANLPDQIRGFGHVKENNLRPALKRREDLLTEYRSGQMMQAA
jgi:indolepyruvate ferredoxin oxidoreductase